MNQSLQKCDEGSICFYAHFLRQGTQYAIPKLVKE